MPPKRKRSDSAAAAGPSNPPAQRTSNASAKSRAGSNTGVLKREADWPVFFQDLFKVFKCIGPKYSNRVLLVEKASCLNIPGCPESIDTQCPAPIRPLELERVAQIKALIPELVRFAYFNAHELRVNAASASDEKDKFDVYDPSNFTAPADENEQVLVLDFVESNSGSRPPRGSAPANGYMLPVALTPAAIKKLIEKRNERFSAAVDELVSACRATSEDPVILITSAAQDHIPVDPTAILEQRHASTSKSLPAPSPSDRKSISTIIEDLKTCEEEGHLYRDQIVHERVFEPREARWGQLDHELSSPILGALKAARNVTGFYGHQAAAINAIWSGKNVIVSTSTASGKSIIYQVPVLCALEKDRSVTAIFIYPTKALAQDQKGALEQILHEYPGMEGITVATYDGDTPQDQRAVIRKTASIIFTNFDMLHASILPNEEHWRRFLKNLHLIVVDELHYYSNVFGSHVSMIMRRLRRDIEVITEDSAPAGQKHFLLWNPPYLDSQDPSLGKVSSMSEACWLFRNLLKQGVRTIMFCKIRRICEAAMKAVRTELTSEGRTDILAKVKAYRGGYSQKDRRAIEHEAFSGNLLGIIATNALELGVDIGTLDAVIVLGFPFGIASLRQQMGRAGRRARDALTILVADERPIDQHYVNNPEELFSQNVGELHIDLDNQIILESHLQCAAHEMPIHAAQDESYFGPSLKAICESSLKPDKEGWFHANPKFLPYPSKFISIRGIQEEKYALVDVSLLDQAMGEARVLEELEMSRAMYELYEGGVFMHQGQTFIIKEVSHDQKLARIIKSDVNWTTRPRDFKDIDALQTFRIRAIKNSSKQAFYGSVQVSVHVFGFFKLRGNTILDIVDIQTMPYERTTTGIWMDVPKTILDLMKQKGVDASASIHAAQHAILNQTYLASDMKTECKVPQKEFAKYESSRKRPARLIFYDAAGDGSGICAKAFDHISTLIRDAASALERCPCEDGCPSCIQGTKCTEGNIVSSKIGASLILKSLLDVEIDADSIPNFGITDLPDTIVEAESVRKANDVKVESDE
ncbi:DEAD/DEAH box helicase [Ceratobasidium sp. AG-Ba]|nr:DEAD/DEAH box helicase [Ceratobasidium sp. AG-Ba]